MIDPFHSWLRDLAGASGMSLALSIFGALTYVLVVGQLLILSQGIRDVNYSGWFALVGIVPILGILAGLVMLLVPGSYGENVYGIDPRESGTRGTVIGQEVMVWIFGLMVVGVVCLALVLFTILSGMTFSGL